MKTFTVTEIGRVALLDAPEPTILTPSDVLLRVTMTSICGSDVHLVHGALPSAPPYPLGHEYVGVVEATGAAVTSFSVGDRVVGPAAPWCGSCARCRAGQIQACLHGGVFGSSSVFGGLSGAMSQHMRIPFADRVLSRIPDALSDEQALLLGDVVPTGMTAVSHALAAPGGVLLVLGCGPVGLSAVLTAKLFGPSQVIAVDRVAGRLAVASELGATLTIDASTQDVAAIIAEATGGRGVDGVVEAVGLPATIQQACELVTVGGRIAVVGISAGGTELPMPQLLFKNVSLWTGLGYLGGIDTLLDLVARGVIDPMPMITDRTTLADIETAFTRFSDPANGVVKYAITV